MNISRRSWHYRLLVWMDFNTPNDLCSYFWLVMLAIVMGPFKLVVLDLIILKGLDAYENRVISEPGLFRARYLAWKEGVCPLVEFVE